MKKALLACVVVVVLSGLALWFLGRQQNTAGAPRVDTEVVPQLGSVVDAPTVDSRRVDSVAMAIEDAGVEARVAPAADPVEQWSDIPVDQQGKSLGARTKFFNRALIADARGNLAGCVSHVKTPNTEVTVELFAEAREGAVRVKYARVGADAGLDLYAARCVEAAFERDIPLEQPDVAPGRLYRFSYPLVVNPQLSSELPDAGE